MRISTPFYIGTTEVTQGQYEAVTGNNPSYFSPKGDGKDKVVGQPYGDISGRASFVVRRSALLQQFEREGGFYPSTRSRRGRKVPTEGTGISLADGGGMGIRVVERTPSHRSRSEIIR